MNRIFKSLICVIVPALLSFGGMARAQLTQQNLATVSAVANYKSIQPGQSGLIGVVLQVRTGYHAQSSKPLDKNLIPLEVKFESSPTVEFSPPQYPPGVIETYPALGTISVYNGKVTIYVPFKVKADAAAGSTLKLAGSIKFQICNDRTCYQPQDRAISIELPIVAADVKAEPANADVFEKYRPTTGPATQAASNEITPPPPTPTVVVTDAPPKQGLTTLAAFGSALLAGLLFNIMPCVLPVLPLKAIGFYEAAEHKRSRAFALGLVFSAGIISVFALLACFVIVFKSFAWGDLFSKPGFIWGMVLVLIVLSIGLLGGWNLSLPLGVYTFEPRHDTFAGNYFWGVLTAVLATPCTAPLLPAVLAWALTHSTGIGVIVVIMVGVGMSLPYLVLSAMPELARRFPRTGPWSELFKQMMGFMLLASAAYFGAGRLIAGGNFWWAVTAVIGISGIFLIARTLQLSPRPRPVAISSIIAVVMIGSMFWWTRTVLASEANWEPYSTARFEELRSSGKPILVKFTANWCGSCQYVEGTVYRNPSVWRTLKADGFTALKVDLTLDDAPGKDLLLKLNPSGGIPLTAIWMDNKSPIQLESIYTTNDLLEALKQSKRIMESSGHSRIERSGESPTERAVAAAAP